VIIQGGRNRWVFLAVDDFVAAKAQFFNLIHSFKGQPATGSTATTWKPGNS
jgi:hypothetical protein